MIVISVKSGEIFHAFEKAYPVGGENTKWCYADSTVPEISCARERGHDGPHRRYTDVKLYLWYNPEDAEKERTLEVCVRLGVVPTEETK